jgi:hypothetical protein
MDPVQSAVTAFLNAIQSAQGLPDLPVTPQAALSALLGQDVSLTYQGSGPNGLEFTLPSGQTVTAQGTLPYPDGTQLLVRVAASDTGLRLQTLQAQPPAPAAILAPLFQGEALALLTRLTQPDPPPELEPLVQLFQMLGGALPQGTADPAASATPPPAQGAGQPASTAEQTTSGQTAGATSGQTAGATSGQTAGATPGQTAGATSGQTAGATPGQTAVGTPAQTSGTTTVATAGTTPGAQPATGQALAGSTQPTTAQATPGTGQQTSNQTASSPAQPTPAQLLPSSAQTSSAPASPTAAQSTSGQATTAAAQPGTGQVPTGAAQPGAGQTATGTAQPGSGQVPAGTAQPGSGQVPLGATQLSPGQVATAAAQPASGQVAATPAPPGSGQNPATPVQLPPGQTSPTPPAAPDAPTAASTLASPDLAAQAAREVTSAAQNLLPSQEALQAVFRDLPEAAVQTLRALLRGDRWVPEAALLDAAQRLQTAVARHPELPPGQGEALVQLVRNLVRGTDAPAPRATDAPLPQAPPQMPKAAAPESWESWLKAGVKALSDPSVSPREAPFHAAQAKEGTAFYELPLPWASQSPLQMWVEGDGQGKGKGAKGGGATRVLLGMSFTRLGETRLGLAKGPEGLQVRVWAQHPEALQSAQAGMEEELRSLGTPVDLKILPLEPGPGGVVPSLRSLATGSTFQVLG